MSEIAAPGDRPAVDVVIVSFRSRELLRRCLLPLVAAPDLAIIVIDNASGDGTAEMVAAEFPDVALKASQENLGFARATNLGIQAGAAPYVLALNPDTQVEPDDLAKLVSLMESRPEIGVCGPRLVQPDGTLDHAGRRSFPTILSSLGHFSGIGRRRKSGRLAAYRAPEVDAGPVDAVNGAFMLIRRSALAEIGLFDEGYWMYMEDLDLCYRFAEAGWLTWYEPSVSAMHVKGGSAGARRGPRLNYAFHYGMYRFYRTHYASHRPPAVNAAVYCGIAAKLAASIVVNALPGGR
jgi:GT2 family glycosyltransferase